MSDLPSTSGSQVSYNKKVEGRVVHIDADFLAYQVSAESKEELDPDNPRPRKTFEEMCRNATIAADHLMRMAGGTEFVCHLTPNGSTKGGRSEQAMQKEYQANRKTDKPKYLDRIRIWIGLNLNGVQHTHQEADDGLAQALYNAEDRNLVVIASKDKDLTMCPGLHLNIDRGNIVDVKDPFGWIELDDSKSTKKCKGYGTKFFWAQCLMGDTADNIQGLPVCSGKLYQKVQPTSTYITAVKALEKEMSNTRSIPIQESKQFKAVQALQDKTKTCGSVLAYKLLENASSDKECYSIVKEAFLEAERCGHKFVHWKTGEKISPTQALLSDMQLLWMRRTNNPNDVLDWLKEQIK